MMTHQTPSAERQRRTRADWRHAGLEFGAWCLFGVFSAFAIDGPLTPEQSLHYLKTEPGLRVELVAAEPMVVDPVAVAWDERGRMYVVEDRGYPTGPGKGKPPVGQVVMLDDT